MKQTNKADLAAKFEKMGRLAFDPAAEVGESNNAITLMFQMARKSKIGFDDFKMVLGAGSKSSKLPANAIDPMQFGKYKGMTFDEIYQINPGYLEWILDNVTGRAPLKIRIKEYLESKLKN